MKSLTRKVRCMALVALAVVVAVIFLFLGALIVLSPGKVRPFLDQHKRPLAGGIAEKSVVTINGVKQGMFIKSKNKANPVLLFLHGGPGMPEYTFALKYPTGLEDYFTVCYWDQRGAGLSYSTDIPANTMTAEQIVSDTVAVTDYLRKRFGQDKIYLMGHSWGSLIGIQAAEKAPEKYRAYIGIAQITRQFESEQLAYTYMLEQYTKSGDKRMMKRLRAYPLIEMDTMPDAYRALRDEAMHRLGIGTMRSMRSVVSGIFVPVWLNREYTLPEKINVWRGKWSTASTDMWNQALATDITKKVPKLDIPVYFLHGSHDYTVSYTLAENYYGQLNAPVKGFYTFTDSAHSPLFEEPAKMQEILSKDVLTGVTTLADQR